MQPVHLVVLIHGLYGNIANLAVLKQELELASSSSTISSPVSASSSPSTSASGSRSQSPPSLSPYTINQFKDGLQSEENDIDDGSATSEVEVLESLSLLAENDEDDADLKTDLNLEVVILRPRSIEGSRTWDGVDVNATRVSVEIENEIERLWRDERKDVVKFSVMGYSLGGCMFIVPFSGRLSTHPIVFNLSHNIDKYGVIVIARYLVGLLDHRSPSFFERYQPVSFSTAATPHIGILKYGTRTNAIVHTIGRQLFSRSGQQMYCLDRDEFGHSLLEVMADPDGAFVKALKRFPKIMIIANGCHDLTVPYPSASIASTDPYADHEYTKLQVETDEHHIVQSYAFPSSDEVVVTAGGREEKTIKRRPPFPPFLMIRWPFTYAAIIILPFVLPFFLTYAILLFTLHTWQSYHRTKTHREVIERRPLLAPNEEDDGADDDSMMAQSGTCTPRLYDRDTSNLANRSDSDPSMSTNPSRIPLLLTPQQKLMIKNLNASLPQIERLIAWFPWAFNSHAMLIVRDAKRFPGMEDGRGVVRTWAKFVVNAGRE